MNIIKNMHKTSWDKEEGGGGEDLNSWKTLKRNDNQIRKIGEQMSPGNKMLYRQLKWFQMHS